MTNPSTNPDTRLSEKRIDEILAGLDGVTPGPWQVIEEKHEWSLPERSMMGHDIPAKIGEHLERRIFTTWDHGQLKAPFPVVNSSIGIGKVGEPSVQMVWMQPEDAAHIARMDPDTIRAILTELQALRAPVKTEPVGHDPKLTDSLRQIKAKLEGMPEPLRGPFIVEGLAPYTHPLRNPSPSDGEVSEADIQALAHKFQNILSELNVEDDGEITGTGKASFDMARIALQAFKRGQP